MCSIIGVGERLHKVLGQIDLGTLDSGEQSLPFGLLVYIFHLSSLSNVLSFWRRLDMTEILWFWLLNPNGSCQLLPRMSSPSTG